MPAFEWVHVQLHQQKGMISLSPPTICNSAIGRVISVVPWTAPAPIGGAWALGWDFRAAILVIVLACVSAIIYFPFFKVYEKQLLAQEAEEAERAEHESQQTA
ncbi:PTS system protein [Klebsiella pneumoniae]|nr:PTS system protein [Klebsiella pneumoniae]